MGILTALHEARATPENPNTPLSAPATWLVDWMGGAPTAAGIRISESNALQVGVLFAIVRVISETLATVPLILYRRRGERGRVRARQHPLYGLLHDEPNDRMSSFTWREVISGHLETWGNSYSEIKRTGNGAVVAIEPLRPDRVEIRTQNGALWYLYDEFPEDAKAPRAIPARNILHVPGLGFDGTRGYSPVTLHREALGYNKSLDLFGSNWFGQGSRPSGILSFPGRLKDDAKDAIRTSWNQQHQGPAATGGVAVLEDGLSWTQIGVPPEDAQYIGSRKFSVEDLARIWRMQLHKIQQLDHATFTNITHQAIEHVQDTILPRATRFEQEANRKLLSRADRESHYIEHLVEGLLRGDQKSRYESYAIGRQWGWLSADDVRELENMNQLPGRQGQLYMVPLNMVPADQLEATADPTAGAGAAGTDPAAGDERSLRRAEVRSLTLRRRIQNSMARLLERVAAGFTRQEVDQVRKAVKRNAADPAALVEWLTDYYSAEKFQRAVSNALHPVVLTFAEQLGPVAAEEVNGDVPPLETFSRGYADNTAGRHGMSHRDQLLALIDQVEPDQLVDTLDARLVDWREKTPAKLAAREKVEAGSAIAKAVWAAAGVATLRWVTFGDTCNLCDELSGRVVGIQEAFVSPGDVVDPGDGTAPLTANSTHGHPPLHQGCDCSILPG